MPTEPVLLPSTGGSVAIAAENNGGVFTFHSAPEVEGAAVTSANPMPSRAINGVTITQSIVTIAANASVQLVAANPGRKYLAIMNIGLGAATIAFNQAAVLGQGWAIAPAASPGAQGGFLIFEGAGVSLDQITAISAAGTVFAILEGN
jgi:hypothetical protein